MGSAPLPPEYEPAYRCVRNALQGLMTNDEADVAAREIVLDLGEEQLLDV